MEQRANIKFCFKMGKIATENFERIKKRLMVTVLCLIHRLFDSMQDFRMAMKLLMTTNAVDDQQPFKHLT
jgi:hypothetical protein